jgi:phospholipid-binding lipoprotein MlaA
MTRSARASAVILAATLLGACASIPAERRAVSDPWEPLNRTIFDVNTAIDKVTLKPIAKGYQAIIPSPVRTGVSNFYSNLATPGSVVNNFLQGKPKRGLSELTRFLFNSTMGLGGILDVATAGGLEAYPEDIGQTLAVWGVPSGPYVMLPLVGPSTLRDALLFPIDAITPLYYYDNTSVRDKLQVLRIIDIRTRLLATEKFLEDSKDRYITLRESYLQNREYVIYDGNPPEDDAFFDELMDDVGFDQD